MLKTIRLIATILILLVLVTIVAPDSFIAKIPFLSSLKIFVYDLGSNAWDFFTDLFGNFGDWLDQRAGNIISDTFDKAEETTQNAAKDTLNNIIPSE